MHIDASHFTNTLVTRNSVIKRGAEFSRSISPFVSFTYTAPFQFQHLQHPVSSSLVESEYLRCILISRVSSPYLSKADEQELLVCHVEAR